MRSHLTRRALQRLLAGQPVVRNRLYHTTYRSPRLLLPTACKCPTTIPSRSFFGIFNRSRKDVGTSRVDPGIEKMLELEKRIHLIARLPPAKDLVHAVRLFVEHKIKIKAPIEDFQAARLFHTIQILEENEDCLVEQAERSKATGTNLWSLDVGLCKKIFQALKQPSAVAYTKTHNELARVVWKALKKRLEKESLGDLHVPAAYINILCSTGDSANVWKLLDEFPPPPGHPMSWYILLGGYSKENNEPEMLRLCEKIKALDGRLDDRVGKVMAVHYAKADNVTEAKKWFTLGVLGRDNPATPAIIPKVSQVYQELFEFCIRNGEIEWGQSLFRSMDKERASHANEQMWSTIFLAAAATGKSVDEIDRMVKIMASRSHDGDGSTKPSIDTLNGLIHFALTNKDAYTAERFFGLSTKWNVAPNAQTYILQMDYRLLAGDIDGALASYQKLREQHVKNDEDWLIMNKLLQTLLSRPSTSNETIMAIVADISDKERPFDSRTVSKLCSYHLERDEYFEVVDLLETYAAQYSIAQRTEIRDLLSDYMLDSHIDTGRAWDTYMIVHQIFDIETHRDIRNKVMSFMFDRDRADLATHVFIRMSQHMRANTRPNAESYAIAFQGISRTGDAEALEVIHNLLKLDTDTEPNTSILNGLMLAYTACESPLRALDFWQQISVSPEGPNYNSLHIAFRAAERAPFGYEHARKIWDKLIHAKVEITRDLFASYVGCMSGQHMFQDVLEALPKMKELTGCDIDLFTISSIYNASYSVIQQERLEKWCKKFYPRIWEQILANGRVENELGIQVVKGIDRSLKA